MGNGAATVRRLVCFLGLVGAPLSAQGLAAATTSCINATIISTGRDTSFSVSWVQVSYVGTDSLDEALAHEARHRQQFDSLIAANGYCNPHGMTQAQQIEREVDAYCVSAHVRARRTSRAEAYGNALGRLAAAFPDSVYRTIRERWRQACGGLLTNK